MASMNLRGKIIAWIKIARLTFYPMSFIMYTLGALIFRNIYSRFDNYNYIVGYIAIFLIELCTVITNEYYDYETDRINTNASPFSGGSRVLVENKLGFKEVRTGIIVISCLIIATGYLLLSAPHGAFIPSVLFLLLAGIFMGLGYTAPPFKFSYRGLGELVVGITHSPYVIVCGYVFQAGRWDSSLPWLLSIPTFWATLAAIIIAGIPDYSADKAVGKKTLAVILGSRLASMISICFAILALLSALFIWSSTKLNINSFVVTALIVFHCLMLCLSILNFIKKGIYNKRIDGIMQLALSYIIWFGIVPLIHLL